MPEKDKGQPKPEKKDLRKKKVPVGVVDENEKNIQADLEQIYAESDVKELDHLDQAHHSTLRKLLLGMTVFLLVLTAVSWLGFFFFSPQNNDFGGDGVTIKVEGTESPKSGELVEYLFQWKNEQSMALGTARLEIRVPRSFKILESQAIPEGEMATWQIGSLGPGKRGSLSMKGFFESEVGREVDLQAILTYRPANFNSEFQQVATKTIKIAGTVIEPEMHEPLTVLPGDQVTTELKFTNTSEMALENVVALVTLPDDFILESSEPAFEDKDSLKATWTTIDAGGSQTIKLTGSFAPGAEGHRELKADIGITGDDEEFLHQTDVINVADVFKGDLVSALIVNGQTTNQPVRFGEKMRFTATWRNTGTLPIEDVELTAVIESNPALGLIDWNSLEDRAGGLYQDGRITWTKKQVPALATIEPEDEGALEFSVPLAKAPWPEAGTDDYNLTMHLESIAKAFGGEEVNRTIKTSPITARLVSDTALVAEARYFDEDNQPVGSGPLPPKVGEKTTYRIYWKIDNTLHELGNLKMSTKLPDNVTWTGFSQVDAGDLSFDASTSKLTWSLNRLPTSIKKLNIAFDIDLIPTEQQRGRMASLIDATILEATDTVTGAPMIVTASPLTTALASDESAVGKAKVE